MVKARVMVLLVFPVLLCTASTVEADFVFGAPASTGTGWIAACFSADGLDVYFHLGTDYVASIWTAHRDSPDAAWGPAVNLGPTVNSPGFDGTPWLSPNKLELYFNSNRDGGNYDVWVTTRATVDDDWGTPVNLGEPVNSAGEEGCLSLSADGLEFYMISDRPGGSGGWDLWTARRATVNDAWETPVNLGSTINTSAMENFPCVSADNLVLFFASARPGGYGGLDLYMARRATTGDAWDVPVNLGPKVNSSSHENCARISADGATLYFFSVRPGGILSQDLWQASVIPIVDFNGDGNVDGCEVCTMADVWGIDDSVCDIGPMPWGDEVVDVEDLKVLAEFIGEPIEDPTLLAHWALDETEGDVASDSASGKDGTLFGDPAWRPDAGMVNGALEFDGTDDCIVVSGRVVNPADGPFSILAWVQGGAPGQVLISQVNGTNWLILDPSGGAPMTELSLVGRNPIPPLVCHAVITDGAWHRIGLVWDGAARSLYVDGIPAGQDTQLGMPDCSGGLNIGCDKEQTAGTFFSGLIDEVRIYSRAVKP